MASKAIPNDHFYSEIRQYESMLRPFAFNLTRSREESEDLLQDTFFRALSNQEKYSEGTNIKAWLFTIMRNTFINNYRKKKISKTITDTSDNQFLLNSTKQTEKNGSERSFLAEDIRKAIKQVSKDFTEPFIMHYEGFHYQEISEKLSLPLGTVKSRIFLARKELQSRLRSMGVVTSVSEQY
jgi:RNA polymerase sigma-70 factor, ECF subfamily